MEIRKIHGKHGEAVIYTVGGEHAIDAYAIAQIERICDDAASEGSTIRVMPDVHPGKVGPIGLTMTVGTRLLPNLTGVDAGCGMTTVRCKAKKVELAHLDAVVREAVPAGGAIRKNAHRRSDEANLSALVCARQLRADIVARSLGTLGGGNHFIEAGLGDDGDMFLTVHSGSRHLGVEFTEYYLKQGQAAITAAGLQVPYEVTWIEGGTLDDYLHDIAIVQDYASLNRDIILDEDQFDIIKKKVLRKDIFQLEFDIRNHFYRGPVKYHNIIGILRGSKYPDEYVIAGGHLDSYDIAGGFGIYHYRKRGCQICTGSLFCHTEACLCCGEEDRA